MLSNRGHDDDDRIPRSLALLRTGGRFLEIGKRGIWSHEHFLGWMLNCILTSPKALNIHGAVSLMSADLRMFQARGFAELCWAGR